MNWNNVGVSVPASVAAIITAAGGAEPKQRGMPYAMASIVGALPWIAVALFKELPPEEYADFACHARLNMQQAWSIIGSDNPPAAFDEAVAAAKKAVHYGSHMPDTARLSEAHERYQGGPLFRDHKPFTTARLRAEHARYETGGPLFAEGTPTCDQAT